MLLGFHERGVSKACRRRQPQAANPDLCHNLDTIDP
jgi:hypothetical protein